MMPVVFPTVLSVTGGTVLSTLMGSGFSPASLFAGTDGLWLDRSDLSTLFQDSAGTTPVTAANQLDALKLDKSKGLVLGPELVTNGDFSDGLTGWSDESVGSGSVTLTENGARISGLNSSDRGTLSIDVFGFEADEPYSFIYEITVHSGSYNITGFPGFAVIRANSSGVYSVFVIANSPTDTIRIQSSSGGGDITLKRISYKILPGNHTTQATAGLTSRYQISPFGSEYDGNDDFSATPLTPTLAGTIAVRMRSDTASRIAFGSQPASDGRCYIGLASDGALAGGIGTQATAVIKGSTDIRDVWTTGILTWNGTTVTLYQDGVSVYSAAQSGAVNTTIAMHEGALNNNGTASSFTAGGIAQSIVLDRVMTASEIANLTTSWSTIE